MTNEEIVERAKFATNCAGNYEAKYVENAIRQAVAQAYEEAVQLRAEVYERFAQKTGPACSLNSGDHLRIAREVSGNYGDAIHALKDQLLLEPASR